MPQVAALRGCDVVVCHGGNNTVMESLAAGLPIVALPFATDQFAVAADLVAAGLGTVLDPNRATPDAVSAAVRASLGHGPRGRAAELGRMTRRDPGGRRAARILLTGLEGGAGALGSGHQAYSGARRQTSAG